MLALPVDFEVHRYITVDEEAGRALYYIFVEAEEPASAPLALWLSG